MPQGDAATEFLLHADEIEVDQSPCQMRVPFRRLVAGVDVIARPCQMGPHFSVFLLLSVLVQRHHCRSEILLNLPE